METGRSGHCSLHRRQATDPHPSPHTVTSPQARSLQPLPTAPHNAPTSLRGGRRGCDAAETSPVARNALPPSFTSATRKLFGFNQITGRKLTRPRARHSPAQIGVGVTMVTDRIMRSSSSSSSKTSHHDMSTDRRRDAVRNPRGPGAGARDLA